MTFQISTQQLSKIIEVAAKRGTSIALSRANIQKDIITLAEVKKLYGLRFAKEVRMTQKISWKPLGSGGTSSGVYCMRDDFENYVMNKSLDDIINTEKE